MPTDLTAPQFQLWQQRTERKYSLSSRNCGYHVSFDIILLEKSESTKKENFYKTIHFKKNSVS